jgi:hypothetical protein
MSTILLTVWALFLGYTSPSELTEEEQIKIEAEWVAAGENDG